MSEDPLTVLELCAGGGGQALGLETAGFEHAGLVEIDSDACTTLKRNRPDWNVIEADLTTFDATPYLGTDLVAGGVPCPPFSIAGKQLGEGDERDLFPAALRVIQEVKPRAVMLENVKGLATKRFATYRENLVARLREMDYEADCHVLNASGFGVPQLRPRWILVALRRDLWPFFEWPVESDERISVGQAIGDLIAESGWVGAGDWVARANRIAPTLVGGSKKHGGPDLGPTRARADWAELGVDGLGIGNAAPNGIHSADHMPKLTLRMTARLQGFPDEWLFYGGKTSAYRQIGNAFPPPVAAAVARSLRHALLAESAPAAPRVRLLETSDRVMR